MLMMLMMLMSKLRLESSRDQGRCDVEDKVHTRLSLFAPFSSLTSPCPRGQGLPVGRLRVESNAGQTPQSAWSSPQGLRDGLRHASALRGG